jgi:hypothetical protein
MVWKSAETVAFGVKSPWVVAWYCSNTFPTTLKARNASDRKANVLKTQIVNGYNSAYNKLALKTHNIKRSAHQNTPPMSLYPEAAREIQKIMDEDSFTGLMPAEGTRPKAFRDCAESLYTLQDLTKLNLLVRGENGLDLATEYWYSQGDKNINYRTGKPIPGGNPIAVNALLHIIWKTTKKVGFGIKDKWVVAWYCDVRPLSTLGEVAVTKVESSPLFVETRSAARRLLASSRRMLATASNTRANAMDGDVNTVMVTAKGIGMFYKITLKQAGTKVQSVQITNAATNAGRFVSYRVRVDQTTCGITPDEVAAGQEVVVTCGTAPDYIKGDTVTVETTTDTYL